MSKLRPTLKPSDRSGLEYADTYYRILQATADRRSLIHGELRDGRGGVCAVGCYFAQADIPINSKAMDEIAAFNDSFPNLSSHKRWLKVRQWLQFKVKQLEKAKP